MGKRSRSAKARHAGEASKRQAEKRWRQAPGQPVYDTTYYLGQGADSMNRMLHRQGILEGCQQTCLCGACTAYTVFDTLHLSVGYSSARLGLRRGARRQEPAPSSPSEPQDLVLYRRPARLYGASQGAKAIPDTYGGFKVRTCMAFANAAPILEYRGAYFPLACFPELQQHPHPYVMGWQWVQPLRSFWWHFLVACLRM